MTLHSDGSAANGAGRAAEEAARWLAALTDEQCSETEREAFFAWLRSSTEHVEEFLRLSTIARRASRRSLWPDDDVDALAAAARASGNVAPLGAPTHAPPASKPRRWLWAVAASLALSLGVGALIARPQIGSLLAPAYATAIGEQRSITLDDGSIIQLNSRSRVSARLTRTLRAIELTEGEAIFRVAKDPARPFRVRTDATDIVAVGTAFNVKASAARTVVTVLEGRVRVQSAAAEAAPRGAGGASYELAVGEQLIISGAAPPQRLTLRDTEKVTSWTERRLIFEDTTVGAAAREFARYSPRAIRIEDPRIAERTITGVFDAADPGSLVQFLASDASVAVQAQGDDWVVRSRE